MGAMYCPPLPSRAAQASWRVELAYACSPAPACAVEQSSALLGSRTLAESRAGASGARGLAVGASPTLEGVSVVVLRRNRAC